MDHLSLPTGGREGRCVGRLGGSSVGLCVGVGFGGVWIGIVCGCWVFLGLGGRCVGYCGS